MMEAASAPAEGQVTETEGQEQGQQTQATPDLSAIEQRLSEFTGQIGQRFDSIEQRLGQPEPEYPGYEEPEGFGEPEGEFTPEGDMSPEDAQRWLAQQIQSAAQQQVAPLAEQIEAMRITQDAQAIEAKYPELAKPEVATQAVQAAEQKAQQMGHPELAAEPWFVEMAYLAGKAEASAGSETPADGANEVQLEGAGGAAPATEEPDEGDRMVDAWERRTGLGAFRPTG